MINAGWYYLLQGYFETLRSGMLADVANALDRRLSRRVQEAISQLRLHGNRSLGDGLIPIRDLEQVRAFLSGGVATLIDLPWIVFFIAVLFALHFWLGMTTLVGAAVIFSLTILTNRTMSRARIEATEQANDADWRLLDAALRDTRQAVAEAWNNWHAAEQSVEHFRTAIEAARKAYDGAVIQEKASARTTLDVLDLARDLLNVRTSHVSAMANEYVARASLIAAMGRLEAPLLFPDLQRYDPESNFRKQRGRGDVPLVTSILSGLDSIPVRDLETDRAYRDPAANLRSDNTVSAPQR